MPSDPDPSLSEAPSLCQKCGALLTPGRGDFYIVRVEAFAENSPPVITLDDLAKDHEEAMREIVEQMHEQSEQEMMDGVYRRLNFTLCRGCYREWIEHPTG